MTWTDTALSFAGPGLCSLVFLCVAGVCVYKILESKRGIW